MMPSCFCRVVAPLVLALVASAYTTSWAGTSIQCGKELNSLAVQSEKPLHEYSPAVREKVEALVNTHRILFVHNWFDQLVEEDMLVGDINDLNPAQKQVLAQSIWRSVVLQFHLLARVDSNFKKNAKDMGYSPAALGEAAEAVREVEGNAELKAATIKYISDELETYASWSVKRRAVERRYRGLNPAYSNLGFFRSTGRMAYFCVVGGCTLAAGFVGSLPGALEAGFMLGSPYVLYKLAAKGYDFFKYFRYRTQITKSLRSDKAQKALPSHTAEEIEKPEPLQIEGQIARLESLNPTVTLDSISSVENYGVESEDSIKLVAYELGVIHERVAQSQESQTLKNTLEKILSQKNLTWNKVASQLRDVLPPFQKQVRFETQELERIFGVISKLRSHFEGLINRLETAKEENQVAALADSYSLRASELKAFRKTLEQMSDLVDSEHRLFGQARQNVTSFNNDLSLRVSTAKGPVADEDLNVLNQLHSFVATFLEGRP